MNSRFASNLEARELIRARGNPTQRTEIGYSAASHEGSGFLVADGGLVIKPAVEPGHDHERELHALAVVDREDPDALVSRFGFAFPASQKPR